MRRDILRTIGEAKDVTSAIVLTHNIDFVLVQTVVLSALKRCGHPSLTIFADATCAASSFALQAPLLDGLGIRYRVVGVEMAPGFRFHPKAVLLSGPASATLYVGSGNLTFGGWRENAEAWTSFETAEGTGPFAAFLRYLRAVLELVPLSEAARAEVEEAFDANTHAWAAELSEPSGLLGRPGTGPTLLDQMLARVGAGAPEKVTVCAPYYDEEAQALAAIVEGSKATDIEVVVQPGRTGLTETAWKRGGDGARLAPTTFHRSDEQGKAREAFLHAKFYAFERAGRVVVFIGSANCSHAALTFAGGLGNAELMAMREMSADEFRASFMRELVRQDCSPGLASESPEMAPAVSAKLRVLGASYEAGCLRVAYAPRDCQITGCAVDGGPMPFDRISPGAIGVRVERGPRHVCLEGIDSNGSAVRSALGWVDHEWELRSSARSRSVADAIRTRVRSGQWGVAAWSEVLEMFCAHLRYLPSRLPVTGGAGSRPGQSDRRSVAYSAKDVFSAGYGLPSLSAFLPPLIARAEGRVHSLQQLLLRWFGLPTLDNGPDANEGHSDDPADGREDLVDRPEELPTSTAKDPGLATERERRRVARVVTQMAEAMTAAEFLRGRPPELLGTDLKVASALLRVALQERWLDIDTFLQTTHRIWLALFLDAEGDGRGWLQRRYESAESQDGFVTAIRSPELLSALVAWVVAAPREGRRPGNVRFMLAAALAVARLPWLWDGVDDRAVGRELAELLVVTSLSSPGEATLGFDTVDDLWLRLIQRGHALRRLERALAGWTPAQLAPRIRQERLTKGELLWQGTGGFCVVTRDVQRDCGSTANVLPLRRDRRKGKEEAESKGLKKGEIGFRADLTVPLAALLDAAVVPLTEDFGKRPRDVLQALLTELREGLECGEV